MFHFFFPPVGMGETLPSYRTDRVHSHFPVRGWHSKARLTHRNSTHSKRVPKDVPRKCAERKKEALPPPFFFFAGKGKSQHRRRPNPSQRLWWLGNPHENTQTILNGSSLDFLRVSLISTGNICSSTPPISRDFLVWPREN